MKHAADPLDDRALLDSFDDCTLPKQSWTHESHVRVAWLHLQRDPFPVALQKMGAGIRRLNTAHGVENSPTSGYHETLTCTFMCVIWATIRAGGAGPNSLEFCAANPHLLTRTLPRIFYSRERMNSADARRRFVPPDLAALPQPPDWRPADGNE